MTGRRKYPTTPDGHFFVSRGRLWRCTDPGLPDRERRAAIKGLMQARRAAQLAQTQAETVAARADVQKAKQRLGERGPVWWTDGAPDEGGKHPDNSVYADWWAELDQTERDQGDPPEV